MAIFGGFTRPDIAAKGQFDRKFWSATKPEDAWCDEPLSGNYNLPVKQPFSSSHEKLTRSDHLYDRVLVLDWNLRTRGKRLGSAIFFHQARLEAGHYRATEGCIAISAGDFRRLLPALQRLKRITVL